MKPATVHLQLSIPDAGRDRPVLELLGELFEVDTETLEVYEDRARRDQRLGRPPILESQFASCFYRHTAIAALGHEVFEYEFEAVGVENALHYGLRCHVCLGLDLRDVERVLLDLAKDVPHLRLGCGEAQSDHGAIRFRFPFTEPAKGIRLDEFRVVRNLLVASAPIMLREQYFDDAFEPGSLTAIF